MESWSASAMAETQDMSSTFQVALTPPTERLNRTRSLMARRKQRVCVVPLMAFGAPDPVEFDDVPLGKVAVRRIVVQNPTNKPITASVEEPRKAVEQGFEIDYVDLKLGVGEESELRVGWAPAKGGKAYAKLSIKFGSSRVAITLLGSCKDPDEHKPRTLRMMTEAAKKKRAAAKRPPKAPPNPVQRFNRGVFAPTRPIGSYNRDDVDDTVRCETVFEASTSEPHQDVKAQVKTDETFVVDGKLPSSPPRVEHLRRQTFVVPSPPHGDNIRRETFIVPEPKVVRCTSFVSSTPDCFNKTRHSFKDPKFLVPSAADFSAIKPKADEETNGVKERHVSKELVFQDLTNTLNGNVSFTNTTVVMEKQVTTTEVLDTKEDNSAINEQDVENYFFEQSCNNSSVFEKANASDLIDQFLKEETERKEAEVAAIHLQERKKAEEAAITLQECKKAEDRAIAFQEGRKVQAVETIQRSWRRCAFIRRCRVAAIARQIRAAVVIQSAVRSFLTRKGYIRQKKACISIQSNVRRFLIQRSFNRQRQACIIIQTTFRRFLAQRRFIEKCQSCIKIQTAVRRFFAQRRYVEQRQACIVIQSALRRFLAQRSFIEKRQSCIKIQTMVRRFFAQRRYVEQRQACIVIQSAFRCTLAQRRFLKQRRACILLQNQIRTLIAKRTVNQLREQHACAVLIQKLWRAHCHRSRYLELKNASVCIQRKWRARRENAAAIIIQKTWRMSQCVKSYRRQLYATVSIQRLWRLRRDLRLKRELNCRKHKAATLIQRFYQMHMAYIAFKKTRNAAVFIQLRWRFLKRQERRFLAAESIQRWWSTLRAQKTFQALRSSVTIIQKNWRQRRSERSRQLAAVKIQSTWRQYQKASKYKALKRAAAFIQQRGKFLQYFRRRHMAAITIQKIWRCKTLQRSYNHFKEQTVFVQQRWKFILWLRCQEKSATIIQSAWKKHKQFRKFQKMKWATVLIQLRWKFLEHLRRRTAAVVIQSNWRCFAQKEAYKKYRGYVVYLQQRWKFLLEQRRRQKACTLIQKTWKRYSNVKKYQLMRTSAITIQKNWLRYSTEKKFKQLQSFVVIIQRWWRTREEVLKRQQEERANRAALIIAAFLRVLPQRRRFKRLKWACLVVQKHVRGRRTRLALQSNDESRRHSVLNRAVSVSMANDLERVRENVIQANKNASKEKTLGNVTAYALEYLYTCRSISGILQVLKDLDFSTRHSAVCMDRFLVHGDVYVGILVDFASRCNRSVPHIDIISTILDVLINVSKYPLGLDTLVSNAKNVVSTFLRLMKIYQQNAPVIFTKSCAVLWAIANRSDGVKEFLDEENKLCLKSLQSRQEAHHRRTHQQERAKQLKLGTKKTVKLKVEAMGQLSLLPPWQLNSKVVRHHEDPFKAISVLVQAIAHAA